MTPPFPLETWETRETRETGNPLKNSQMLNPDGICEGFDHFGRKTTTKIRISMVLALGDPKDALGDPKEVLGDPKEALGDPKEPLESRLRVLIGKK